MVTDYFDDIVYTPNPTPSLGVPEVVGGLRSLSINLIIFICFRFIFIRNCPFFNGNIFVSSSHFWSRIFFFDSFKKKEKKSPLIINVVVPPPQSYLLMYYLLETQSWNRSIIKCLFFVLLNHEIAEIAQ